MPQFDPSSFASQIFWLVVVFGALYLLMSRIALPRITEVLDSRSERIANDLDKAELLKRETEQVIAAYESALEKARGEASAIMAKVSQNLAEQSAQREQAFNSELADRIAAAETRIARARDQAAEQVRDIAVELAADVTAKLAGSPPPDTAVTASIDRAMTGDR